MNNWSAKPCTRVSPPASRAGHSGSTRMVPERDAGSASISVRSVVASCLLGVPRCQLAGEPPRLAEISDRHALFECGRKDGPPHVVSALFDGGQCVVDPLAGFGRVRRDDRRGHVSSPFGLLQGSPECDFRGTNGLAGLDQGVEKLLDALSSFSGRLGHRRILTCVKPRAQ